MYFFIYQNLLISGEIRTTEKFEKSLELKSVSRDLRIFLI